MPEKIRHAAHDEVPPLINGSCTALVLGSMLSPKSAAAKFYYAHPQNRFWRVLANVFDAPPPQNFDECAELALTHHIALWDVIARCDIIGAADSTIKDVEYNDIRGLLGLYPSVTRVFTTGAKAAELLAKYNKSICDPIIANAVRLPSTSPLNCAMSLEKLTNAYSILNSRT